MFKNPFNITKAVDYSDKELNDYWVDFPGIGFDNVIKPTSTLPMVVLGSKGSGKTHIMKYFSFTMQSIRHSEDIKYGVLSDGYLGTFLRCSGLNAYRFEGKGESMANWNSIFSYYLELWLAQLLLNNLTKFLGNTNFSYKEENIVIDILTLFQKKQKIEDLSIIGLIDFLKEKQMKIDYSINNWSFTKEKIGEQIEILLNPGDLIFGIPRIITDTITELADLKFIYLMDEYENFTAPQQKYFNTIIRERKNPVCFKIGSRKYGVKTKETLNSGEEIKLGSEYEILDLDEKFRNDLTTYKEFIKQICIKRFNNESINVSNFHEYFEEQNLNLIQEKIINKDKLHILKLEKKISKLKINNKQKRIITSNLQFNKDLILEKANLMLFYRMWKKGLNLIDSSVYIKNKCSEYYKTKNKKSDHHKVIEKYRNDLIDSLLRDNSINIDSYIGFDNLAKISNGIPRHFLIILKHIYRWSEFEDKKVFQTKEDKIDTRSQLKALGDTASWFIEDAGITGENGNRISDSIERLCDYLRELRFSDLPPECSISTFSINSKVIPKEILEILTFLEHYSYLIKIEKGRRDKNFNSRNVTYQVNGLLAYQWELSLSRRGIVNFNLKEATSIFLPKNDSEYRKMVSSSISKYNAPFNGGILSMPSLFD